MGTIPSLTPFHPFIPKKTKTLRDERAIRSLLESALVLLKEKQIIPQDIEPQINIDKTKDKSHGDFASNLALILAKPAKMPPRACSRNHRCSSCF